MMNNENNCGKTVKKNLYNSIGLSKGCLMREYDELGRLTRETEYNLGGYEKEIAEFIYDTAGSGRLMIKRLRNEAGTITSREEYEYEGESDKVHMTRFYNGENVLVDRREYEYGEDGEVVREIIHKVSPPKITEE
ncbi:MAG: hypothetical protein IJ386_04365 [Clostridia bacterium]|nr:hypothetical protein [Clostridia bacterium]